MIDRELRLHRIQRRMILQVAFAFLCEVSFLAFLFCLEGQVFVANRIRIVAGLAVLIFVPLLMVEVWNWRMARRAVSDMWAFGQLNFDEV